jgi:hypothetical protein
VCLVRPAILLVFVSALNTYASSPVAGRWEGSVQIPGSGFNLIVDLDQPDGKEWIGSVIIPGLGVKGAPLAELVINDSAISGTIKGALTGPRTGDTTIKAGLTNDGQLNGEMLTAGNSALFVLRKTGPPQVDLPRKSTPVSKNFVGEWKGDYEMDGYPRHVTLILANNGPNEGTAQLTVVGKRTNKPSVDLVLDENNFLTIQAHDFGISYEGRLGKELDTIKGTFTLGPFELPLTLRRTP